jgi:hypothetical protein
MAKASYAASHIPPSNIQLGGGGGGTIDHLVDMVDTISHRLLVYDHTYVPEIRVCSKQPRGFDEEWGLTITQRS